MLSLGDFDYNLPEELVAQKPVEPRDASRLLVVHRRTGNWEHRFFRELPEYLDSKDLLVANNTRVIKARLVGKRVTAETPTGSQGGPIGGRVEFFMLEQLGPRVWEGLFHASAKYVPGFEFEIPTPDGKGLRGKLVRGAADSPHGTVVAEFDREPTESGAGELPLPKYVKRAETQSLKEDERAYQTVYAKNPGSAAAPTAGLHFTAAILQKLMSRGVGWEEITLNVGLGTFRPVKDDDISKHQMHEERYEISGKTAEKINEAHNRGKRIVAIGTTSVRALESAWSAEEQSLRSGLGRTSLFITPGSYEFQVVDRMITNFHLPKSTLLMLVCAFAGHELMMSAYADAVKERYRFFSYGDAMLIL